MVGLQLGCLVEPLPKQLAGHSFDADTMNHFQRDMEAISRAHVRLLIPYSVAMKAYDKLAKKIVQHVEGYATPTKDTPQ